MATRNLKTKNALLSIWVILSISWSNLLPKAFTISNWVINSKMLNRWTIVITTWAAKIMTIGISFGLMLVYFLRELQRWNHTKRQITFPVCFNSPEKIISLEIWSKCRKSLRNSTSFFRRRSCFHQNLASSRTLLQTNPSVTDRCISSNLKQDAREKASSWQIITRI